MCWMISSWECICDISRSELDIEYAESAMKSKLRNQKKNENKVKWTKRNGEKNKIITAKKNKKFFKFSTIN